MPKSDDPTRVVQVINPNGVSNVVLVCEHASNVIPAEFDGLGLGPADLQSHVAWDPGALAVSCAMSSALGARLVAGCVSRLVFDCNRPPGAPDAMPRRSEIVEIPGNQDLSGAEKASRVACYYDPFRHTLAEVLAATKHPIIVTIHSFTPVYDGQYRNVEIGVLHDTDARLADAMLHSNSAPIRFNIQRNQPYGPDQGVTHTLKEHGLSNGHLNVMLEIRNDLIRTPDQQAEIAEILIGWINVALADVAAKVPAQ